MTYNLEDSYELVRDPEGDVGVLQGFLSRYSAAFFSQPPVPGKGAQKSSRIRENGDDAEDMDEEEDDEDYVNMDDDQLGDERDGKRRRVALTTKAGMLTRKSMMWARDSIEKLPLKLSVTNAGVLTILVSIAMPRTITYMLVYPIFRLVVGNLYPAYASYKAVRTKDVKEYVKWMMYWIVLAIFKLVETFTDIFVSFWCPFYYEVKILFLVWLLCPATKGSSIIYRRFLHPTLSEREAEIDDAIARITEQGYSAVLQLGSKGVNFATNVLMQTAIKNITPMVSETLQSLKSDSAISSSVASGSKDSRPKKKKKSEKDRTDGANQNHFPHNGESEDEFELSDGTVRGIAEALESDDTNSGDSSFMFKTTEDEGSRDLEPKKMKDHGGSGDHKLKMNLRRRGKRLMVIDSDEESDNES